MDVDNFALVIRSGLPYNAVRTGNLLARTRSNSILFFDHWCSCLYCAACRLTPKATADGFLFDPQKSDYRL